MSLQTELEREVRDTIKKNRWLTISTTSQKGVPQSSVVVYASDGHVIYVLTGKDTVKIRNIKKDNRVSVTIPFYKNLLHRMITLAPPAAISFRARAETLDISDRKAAGTYRKVLKFDIPENILENGVWIKLTPGTNATCHGVGVSLLDLKEPLKAHKIIKLTSP